MKKAIIVFLVFIFSCSYSVHSSSYPHLKTVLILPFSNKSIEYEFEETTNNELIRHFNDDGRLKIVHNAADCKITGEILDYSNKIKNYNGSDVDEYEIKVLFKINFADNIKNKIIWNNDALMLSEKYSETNENSEFHSEEEAQLEIIKNLYEIILKNSLEQW